MLQKIKIQILLAVLTLTVVPTNIYANPKALCTAISSANPTTPTYIKVALLRLDQINEMDKSKLNHSEKKALRTEVKAIKETLRVSNNGGIYLSGGAVIIIIILLIILL